MTDCKKYQMLIDKHLNGDIDNAELAELKTHTRQCASCREELKSISKMSELIQGAFAPGATAQRASDGILPKLPRARAASASGVLFTKPMAAAASIMLVAGFLLGLSLGRMRSTTTPAVRAAVPMRVDKLEGTVLVKHRGSDAWAELKPDSDIYLGDTFHAAPKATVCLEFTDKSNVTVSENSMLELRSYNGGTEFYLDHGVLAAALESPHPPFAISTPHGRVEALGTEFTVTVE